MLTIFLLTSISYGVESINISGFATGGRGIPYVVIDSIYQVEEGIEVNYLDVWQLGGTISNLRYLDTVEVSTPGVFISSVEKRNVSAKGIAPYKDTYTDRGISLFERETEGLPGWEIENGIPGQEVGMFDMNRNGGWVNSLMLEYIWVQNYPWVFSEQFGWMYLVASTPNQEQMDNKSHFNEFDWKDYYGGISYYLWNDADGEWIWLFLNLETYSEISEAVLWSYTWQDWYTLSEYWPAP